MTESQTAQLQAELDQLKEAMQSMNTALDQRLSNLEQQVKDSDHASSSEQQSNQSDQRARAWRQLAQRWPDAVDATLCRRCALSEIMDGREIYYQSEGRPLYQSTGFVFCRAIQSLRTIGESPVAACSMFESAE